MRIRTRLQLSVVLSVVLATTVGLLFILSIHAMNEASRKAEIAAEVVKGVVELKILTDEYLLHPGDRSLIQWRSRYNSITKRLTGGYFRRPDDKIAVDQILKNLQRIKPVFGEITCGIRKEQRLDKQTSAISRARQDRLEAELMVKAQSAVSFVFPLQQEIQAELVTTQKRSTLLTVVLLLILTVVIVGISVWVNRSIARPIAKLEEDTQIIGSGNLEHKAGTTAKDEIGQLSRAFDEMTKELRETTVSKEYVENIIKSMIDTLVVVTPEGKIQTVNQATCDLLGYQPEELIGQSIEKIFEEEEQKLFHKTGLNELIKKNFIKGIERRYLTKDGKNIPVLFSGSVMRDSDGRIQGITCLASDISELKRAEETLRESETFLDATGQIAKVGGWQIDGETKKVFWTKEIYNITEVPNHYDPSSLEKDAIVFFNAEDQIRLEKAIQRAFEQNEPYDMEFQITTAKGNKKWVQAICNPITVDGKTVKLTGTFQDITERKQAEEQIKASLKEKEVLLREIHHRVKNNMQVIISLLKLQSSKVKDKQYADMLKASQDRIKAMSLIHEKFYQSKDFANIDFREYVKNLVNSLIASHGVDTNKIRFNVDVKDVVFDLENAIPYGLIIHELVSNSLKHAFPDDREGEIKITLYPANEEELELTFSDDGIGMPEDLDFDNMETLGLELTKDIIEHQLGGKIELDRTKGTTFHVLFKVQKYKVRI